MSKHKRFPSGRVLAVDRCVGCNRGFVFNPGLVPVLIDGDGIKHPVCRECFEERQRLRRASGQRPESLPEGAYWASEVN